MQLLLFSVVTAIFVPSRWFCFILVFLNKVLFNILQAQWDMTSKLSKELKGILSRCNSYVTENYYEIAEKLIPLISKPPQILIQRKYWRECTKASKFRAISPLPKNVISQCQHLEYWSSMSLSTTWILKQNC